MAAVLGCLLLTVLLITTIFYFHPWEIDPGQPRVPAAPHLSRFRHRVNLSAMQGRLDRLLRDFAWDRMDRVFAQALGSPAL